MTWEAISGFITAGILLLTIFITASFYLRQVRASRRSTIAQLVVELFQTLRDPETIEILRYIYKTDFTYEIHSTDKKNVEWLLDWLDLTGHLVKRGIIDDYLAVESFAGAPTLRCWYQLETFIDDLRKQRGGRYSRGLQYYVRCIIKYQIEHMPYDQWICFEQYPSKKNIKLIDELQHRRNLISENELRIVYCRRMIRNIQRRICRKDSKDLLWIPLGNSKASWFERKLRNSKAKNGRLPKTMFVLKVPRREKTDEFTVSELLEESEIFHSRCGDSKVEIRKTPVIQQSWTLHCLRCDYQYDFELDDRARADICKVAVDGEASKIRVRTRDTTKR